jgi:hypothetical protein
MQDQVMTPGFVSRLQNSYARTWSEPGQNYAMVPAQQPEKSPGTRAGV